MKVVLVEPGGFKTNIWDDFDRDVQKRGDSRFGNAYRRSLQGQKLAERIMGEPAQVRQGHRRRSRAATPRARYLVGLDAQLMALTDQLTPTVIKDRVFRLALGL